MTRPDSTSGRLSQASRSAVVSASGGLPDVLSRVVEPLGPEDLPFVPEWFDTQDHLVDFILVTSSILFEFKGLGAASHPDAPHGRGTEKFYWWVTSGCEPSVWDVQRLAGGGGLADVFQPALEPAGITQRRVAMGQQCAASFAAGRAAEEGGVAWLRRFDRACGPGGLLEWVSGHVSAYRDPVLKKATVMARYLVLAGVWDPVDADQIPCSVDYHVMRVALRLGLAPSGGRVEGALRMGGRLSEDEITKLRVSIGAAVGDLARSCGVSSGSLDKFLWTIGREVCMAEPTHEKCVLADVCPSSTLHGRHLLQEPVHLTTSY